MLGVYLVASLIRLSDWLLRVSVFYVGVYLFGCFGGVQG